MAVDDELLLDADIEAVEERVPHAVGGAVEWLVAVGADVVDAARDRREGVATHEPERAAELPAVADEPDRGDGEDVRLVEVEQTPDVVSIASLGPAQRVAEEPGEGEAGLAVGARRKFHAVDAADAV
ncbi:MAG: hypothetical protein AAF547_17900, partial [Actinomycetota bacterium]